MPSVSDLRREFETPPYSRQVALGTQVEMRCHPPKGKPTPMVTWLKNGSPVRESGNGGNLLVTGSGHLIVVKTRWADAANYSCVAENVAARRVSQAAQLAVYGKINFKLPHVPSNHMSITFNQSGFYLPTGLQAWNGDYHANTEKTAAFWGLSSLDLNDDS